MFNSTRNPLEPQYQFNFLSNYKIWFSPNKDEFLNLENQVRFISMRESNPHATLYFIYSTQCLSDKAVIDLNTFCMQFNITPIAFEDIEQYIKADEDRAIYQIAQEEITLALNHLGGNFASASDCTRLLKPVIEQCGVYSDFDVVCNLSTLTDGDVLLRGPLLFPLRFNQNKQQVIFFPNSDTLAFSYLPQSASDVSNERPRELSEQALVCLRNLQRTVIKNYQQSFSWTVISPTIPLNEYFRSIFNKFDSNYSGKSTVYNFRYFLQTFTDFSLQEQKICQFLFNLSVINMAGPGVYTQFFHHLLPTNYQATPEIFPAHDKSLLPIMKMLELCGTGFYDPIFDLIKSDNSAEALTTTRKDSISGDRAWTKEGLLRQKDRGKHMLAASSVIATTLKTYLFWKKNTSADLLLADIFRHCKDKLILSPIKDKQYGLALRRACAQLNLPVIKLLIKFYQTNNHPFNLNEPSSNSNTALDWVTKASCKTKEKQSLQKNIIDLLIALDAKRQSELYSESNLTG